MVHSIVLVDDHLLIAEALTGIIEKFKGYKVLYEAANGRVLMERFRQSRNIPDIVLLDITMPEMNGFETAQWLKEHHPGILILALSMQDEEDALIRMVRCGARGYLLKNIRPAELERALDSLVQKGYYYPDWMAHKVFTGISKQKDGVSGLEDQLSAREVEFLQYAASELTYKEIAERMYCSARTVEGYRDSLFDKFGLKTRIGLVLHALKKGIIKMPHP